MSNRGRRAGFSSAVARIFTKPPVQHPACCPAVVGWGNATNGNGTLELHQSFDGFWAVHNGVLIHSGIGWIHREIQNCQCQSWSWRT